MSKPLSVWKYYQHNHRKVNLVFAITFLSVFLQYALLVYVTTRINLTLETPLKFFRTVSVVKLVKPTREKRNTIIKLLKQQATVAKVIPFNDSNIPISPLGDSMLIYLKSPEIKPLMRTLNLNLTQGRLPKPGSHEVVLHWRIAANKRLKIGDCFSKKLSDDGLLAKKYQLTGLIGGKRIMGFADLDQYLQDRQLSEEKLALLIVAKQGKQAQVKQYLKQLSQKNNKISTAAGVESYILNSISDTFRMVNTIHLVITGIIAICTGFLFYLYFYQRRTEFGLLKVMGHTQPMIVGRSFIEILVLNLLGFGGALGIALIGGWFLDGFVFQTRGLSLTLWEPDYLLKLSSTPLFITCCSLMPVWRMLKKIDPISIIERAGSKTVLKTGKPLSNWKYFCNNQRLVAIVFLVTFLSCILLDALLNYTISLLRLEQRSDMEPWTAITYTGFITNSPKKLGYLRKLLDKHPSIVKVLPYLRSTTKMNGVDVNSPSVFYLNTKEIQPVMTVLKLKLIKGRLPTPGSYEIVIHWQLAANWGIKIGDPVNKSRFRLVGLLEGKSILGLANLERLASQIYLSNNNLDLLIIPKKGQLGQVKLYLSQLQQKEQEIVSSVSEEQIRREETGELNMIINVVYLMITGIVTLCVSFLYYLYFFQRRPEFGMLEALGLTMPMIISRAFREIFKINLLGFLLGSATTYCGAWFLNNTVLNKCGLPLVLLDPSYPGRLLPIPLVITFCSLIPVWRILTKADPIAMIEGEE
jgi:ABC-type antimicrobial peptide transport system permease subunit